MTDQFSQDIALRVVAQICQMIGYDKVTTSPLYILADILKSCIRDIGRIARQYAEHCGRFSVDLRDLSLAFHDYGIYPSELLEFLQLVSPLPQAISVPKYPVTRAVYSEPESNENIQVYTHGSRENLKIVISLSKIKEAGKARRGKSAKLKKKKKNKGSKKNKKEDS